MNKPMVSESVTIVALKDNEYRGIWSGLNVIIPFDNYPNNKYDYEFQTYEPISGKGTPCLVTVRDYTARVNVLENANYSGSIINGKLILDND